MWSAIAAIGALLLLGLKIGVYFYKKNRTKPTYEEDKQKMENAIARGHADDITAMFDDLRRPPSATNSTGKSGSEKTS